MKTNIASLSPLNQVLYILNHASFVSAERLILQYCLFFQSMNAFSDVISELKIHIICDSIPLSVVKAQCAELEKIIHSLAGITLQTELKFDVLPVTTEIKEKLNLGESSRSEYLESSFQKLASDMYDFYKDKNLHFCLDHLKEKTWCLLEALNTYAKEEYNHSIL